MDQQSESTGLPASMSVVDGPDDELVRETTSYWAQAYESRTSRIPDEKLAPDAALMQLRRVWEVEVEAMSVQLSAARSRLNAFCAIYKLPAEILAYVFELLAAVSPVAATVRRWGWVNVTHVSRRFRIVALDRASLWSSLSINRNTPWDIFLPRSRRALLSVYGDTSMPTSPSYLPHVLQNLERIRSIRIDEIDSLTPSDHSWLIITRMSLPELRILKLEMSGSDMTSGTFDWMLDRSFLLEGSPKLQHLELAGIRIPWTLPSPLSLISLDLSAFNLVDNWKYSAEDVLRFLRHSVPLLQYLRLWEALPSIDQDILITPVILPHLRTLWFIDFEVDGRCVRLWESLSIPPTCSVMIETESLDEQNIERLGRLIKRHIERPGCPVYRHIGVGNRDANGRDNDIEIIRFSAHSTNKVLGRWMERGNFLGPHITQDPMISFQSKAAGGINALYTLLALFPCEPVESLALTSWLPILDTSFGMFFRRISQHFTYIKTLEVRDAEHSFMGDDLAGDFCDYLLTELAPSAPADRTMALPCIPYLHTLSLHHFHFDTGFRDRRLRHGLLEAFQRRYALDIPIRTLRISKSDLRESWLQTWRGYVDDVWYDPKTCHILGEDLIGDDVEDEEVEDDDEGVEDDDE
ncbi:hypothetical protein PENSPDRAFT_754386 [Peniophora sp. CONT]|nr:hypothetical protein PENSPDRAFT_754386 [Peniophora sp. CONT]